MCGIAGSLGFAPAGPLSMTESVHRMVASLVHRGPDDVGVWSDAASRVALGTRRLAIMDPSHAGRQPMHSASGRYVVSLNGEIYNHDVLRGRLDRAGAVAWRSRSDTEVLASGFDAWGVEATLAACIGMFAIAVWDSAERRLTLARDRIGEKPLYYGRFDGTWLFGSEIKAVAAHASFRRRIDRQALASYMSLGYVPAPGSIFEGLRKVMPGRMIALTADGETVDERTYWSAHVAARMPKRTFARDVDAIDALETLLSDAVARQMTADRPVGALLSGGIDSSTVVALMTAQQRVPVKTFAIGFDESAFNEARFAATVARHCGTDHTELYVNAGDVRDTVPLLPSIYDEPFADISQLPAYLVSRLASRSVTVALTGDGGDELFGGYPRYGMGARLWPTLQRVPRALRPAVGALLQRTPGVIDHAFSRAFPHDEVSGVRGLRPAQKMVKLGRAFGSRDIGGLYWRLLAPWAEPELLRRTGHESPYPADSETFDAATIEENFMLRDLVGYLPDDMLAKMDRASMAVSLESRAPLLDHRVVEFALQLPYEMKYRSGVGKWLLRQVLHRHVPQHLVDRPKMGFGIPIASWLRGPLKPWAHDLVASSHSEIAELLDLRTVRRMLDRHSAGVGDWHQPLWTALMFLNWAHGLDEQVDCRQSPDPQPMSADTRWTAAPFGA